MAKKLLIVANWKMNPGTQGEASSLAREVAKGTGAVQGVEVVLCPPFSFLGVVCEEKGQLKLGAQDCAAEQKGAFTGEVSPSQLKGMGCSYVILGHSERKNLLGETLGQIAAKLQAALQAGLIPVLCVGEKKRGERKDVVRQAGAALQGIAKTNVSRLVLVYEPEWAISSRKGAVLATPEEVGKAVEALRELLSTRFGKEAHGIPILYGGSADSRNIQGFLQEGNVQGALVGAASLRGAEFVRLVKNALLV
ncbi:triose-phosphate isomerase [Patescibacteria group bacterium]|nr:triose-phosphate isomerase [Patescibacteria group bacterium]